MNTVEIQAVPSALNPVRTYTAKHDAVADRIEERGIPTLKGLKQNVPVVKKTHEIATYALGMLAGALIVAAILAATSFSAPVLAIGLGVAGYVAFVAGMILANKLDKTEMVAEKAKKENADLDVAINQARTKAAMYRMKADEARKAKFETELAIAAAKHHKNFQPLLKGTPKMNRDLQAFLKGPKASKAVTK